MHCALTSAPRVWRSARRHSAALEREVFPKKLHGTIGPATVSATQDTVRHTQPGGRRRAGASSDEPIATRERKRHKTRNGEKRVSLSFAPRMFAKHRSPRDPMVQYWVEPSSPMLSLSGAGGPHPLILASMRCRLRWNVARAGVRGLGVSALACPPSMLSLISITI